MQATERIHVGGKPAQSQPELPKRGYGQVNFRRLVIKSREQSEPEKHAGTQENTEASEQEVTEEVRGDLYSWSSNIGHLKDTKVKVEDLSGIDIDAQLGEGTQKLLSKALNCNAETISDYSRSVQPGGVVREEFTVRGSFRAWPVCRITFNHIDVRNGKPNQYSGSLIAKRIMKAAEANVAPPPSEDQVKHVAYQIVADRIVEKKKSKLPSGSANQKGKILRTEAQEKLFIHRDDAAYKSDLEREMQAAERPAAHTPEILSLVQDKWPRRPKHNQFHEFLLDTEKTNLCERLEGFDVVILRDKNGELICGVIPRAVQKLLPVGTVDKMSTAAEAFAWRFPFKRPDPLRHITNQVVHLARFPDKDVRSKECKQPHFAVCGVEHYGVHHEVAHYDFKSLHFKEFSPRTEGCPDLLRSPAWKEEFPKLKDGVYGIATKVSRLSLKSWDEVLYNDCVDFNEWLPDPLKATLATTGDNPYGYMAHLVDPLTEGHTDSKDLEKGMAALTCFGEFEGGDLVLPQLGVRIPFPSGSNCHLRGRQLYHLISDYEGIRHSIVLTNKESVREISRKFKLRYEEKMAKVEELQSKDRKVWTDDEAKLHEASMKGKSAVLELIWRSEAEKEKAMEAQKKAIEAQKKAIEAQQKAMKAQQKAMEAQQKAMEEHHKAKNNKRKAEEEMHKADDTRED